MNKLIINLFACLAIAAFFSQSSNAAEFLVKDATVEVRTDVDPWQGSWKWEYDGAGPEDWTFPLDYYNGTFHFRFEIIDQPTNRACAAQFVIWQDWNYPEWKEQAAGHVSLNGEGTVAYASGTPASWWAHDEIPLDFSRPNDFYKLGIMFWSADPWGLIAAFMADKPGYDIYDEIWADRGDWFPMTFRLTIVAVDSESAFSGNWAQYMGGASGVQPSYSINYEDEETNENVLEQHEYSYDNTTWHDGSGSPLSLTPLSNVYFRDKIDNGLTQTLIVPDRLPTPSFTIDYEGEQTAETVSSAYEYSTSSDMSGANTGSGGAVSLTPGTNMYFRQLATSSAFKSGIQAMDIIDRPSDPSFSINFFNETTAGAVSSDIEYSLSSSMSGANRGSNTVIPLTPGNNVYFRTAATTSSFTSEIFGLNVPERPADPEFGIDFENETTIENITSDVTYADNASFTGAQAGEGSPINLTPGEEVFFRISATSSSFASDYSMLSIPERPLISSESTSPTFENPIRVELSFNYATSSLNEEKLVSGNSTFSVVGGEYDIDLTPDSYGDISFQALANAVPEGSFASEVFTITYAEEANGLDQSISHKVELFPNPTSGILHLTFSVDQEPQRITVIDDLGRVVVEEAWKLGQTILDLSHLPSGIYSMRILVNESDQQWHKISILK